MDREPKPVPDKFAHFVEQIEKLSVLDLAELVKVLEARFGVSAAATFAAAAAPASGAPSGEEEKSSFTVELTAPGANKIPVIKLVREVTGRGLKESKDLVDGAPKVLKEGLTKKDAEEVKAKLEAVGAKVTLK